MKDIIRWTLWQRRWSTMWWSFSVAAFIFINMIFYPTFKDQAAELQKSFESMPEAALQLVGGSADFFSPVGFLNSQVFFLMLPMLLGILAIGLGSSLLAREEQDRTIEMLLSRPISRSKLLLGKALAGLTVLAIVASSGLVTTVVAAKVVDLEVSTGNIVLATIACLLLTLTFGAVAFALTATGRARGASLGIASGVAIGGYLVSSLSGTVTWLKGPSKVFPFHYFESEAILRGTFDWLNILYFVGLIALLGFLSWLSFRRRDLA